MNRITQRMYEGPSQLTGTQQSLAERGSLAADIIYCALRPDRRAKLFPGLLTIKGPKKIPMHWEIQGKVPACNSDHSSSCTRAVPRCRDSLHEQREAALPRVSKQPAQCASLHTAGAGGELAVIEPHGSCCWH